MRRFSAERRDGRLDRRAQRHGAGLDDDLLDVAQIGDGVVDRVEHDRRRAMAGGVQDRGRAIVDHLHQARAGDAGVDRLRRQRLEVLRYREHCVTIVALCCPILRSRIRRTSRVSW